MKAFMVPFVLGLTLMLLMTANSCTKARSIDDSIVQVWKPAATAGGESTLLAFGIAVGDGSQILTVLNYENYTPDSLEVGLPGQKQHKAIVQAIDPRTSATLLKLEDAKFPTVAIGNNDALKPESEIVVHGWVGPDFEKLEKRIALFSGYDKVFFVDVEQGPYVTYPGATVTDSNDRVIGLIGTLYDAFVYRLGGPNMSAPIINIQSALELFSPNAVNQPWAGGPAFSLITTKDTVTGNAPSTPVLGKYNEMAAAIHSLLSKISESLPPSELPENYRSFLNSGPENPPEGTLLSVVYPRPVELKNTKGQVVAEAKWLGIQWGRSEGKPNRVFYGYIDGGNAIVSGGFILNGNITELENTLH